MQQFDLRTTDYTGRANHEKAAQSNTEQFNALMGCIIGVCEGGKTEWEIPDEPEIEVTMNADRPTTYVLMITRVDSSEPATPWNFDLRFDEYDALSALEQIASLMGLIATRLLRYDDPTSFSVGMDALRGDDAYTLNISRRDVA